jgi:hypothetical protein
MFHEGLWSLCLLNSTRFGRSCRSTGAANSPSCSRITKSPRSSISPKKAWARTRCAPTSDLGYLEARGQATTGEPVLWPPRLILKFIAHHLWDPAKKAKDNSRGVPNAIGIELRGRGILRQYGPRTRSTGSAPHGQRAHTARRARLTKPSHGPGHQIGPQTPIPASRRGLPHGSRRDKPGDDTTCKVIQNHRNWF